MKKLYLLTENPTAETILDEKFNNRHGDYLEMLLNKSGFHGEEYELIWIEEFNGRETGEATIVTLGQTPTRMLLKLPKSFKMGNYVGKRFNNVVPWYSPEHLLTRGKKLEQQTIELLGKLK